ncbi:cation:proton antiporter [Methanoregula sp. UBA64]|jgi:monovalent cation:H+ antiporter-2, CPA2 family|uniref:cation:proton antiporter domain-containing protein n=1 Tax=Methanoregula sp. UBA64 TaxID=1915554 RepID=UPI0025CBC360|nr:cation:proton antiporter [Methanoregula sp. UBA64]
MDVILAVVCLGILTIALLFLGQRFKIPSIVCFLVIGMLAGPYALSIVSDQSTIETIGEIGVILLLFTIGLEFSFERLLKAWRVVVIGGAFQVCTTILVAALILHFLNGVRFTESIFFGFLVSLSSTAIVMKILQDRGEVETVPGRTLLGILIFQDLAVIPMILLTPIMMGSTITTASIPFEIGKVVAILAVLIVSAHWVVPWVMYRVAKQKNRELFVFTIAGICFAVAWLTNAAGLSYSLGAFMAGLIIGESEFSIDAVSNIIPFRDVFAAIFFISIGMLLDTSAILAQPSIVISLLAIILVAKVLTGSVASAILGMPIRVSIFVGLALAQIGEFSFVLAKSGSESNLMGTGPYQFFLAAAIITMALTPFTMNAAQPITNLMYRLFPDRIKRPDPTREVTGPVQEELSDHIVIVGYGMTGKSVARAAEILGIPYNAIDMDPDVVARERQADRHHEVIFGDATHREVLAYAGIERARALVVVISEQNVVPGIIHLAREMAPDIYIVVRTRHVNDVQQLLDLGADEVIPEEFETSVRIFSRVLAKYSLPDSDIDTLRKVVRNNGYRLFSKGQAPESGRVTNPENLFAGLHIRTLLLAEGSWVQGKTLRELDAWNTYSVGILAIRRGTSAITAPNPDLQLQPDDLLILYGSEENIQKFLPQAAGESAVPGNGHTPAPGE